MSVPNTPENAIPNYYPGASYTDYVAVDGFNFGTPWRSFTETFQEPLKLLAGYGKPIYILSLASAEGPQKAAWIKDFGARLKEYPLLKGWVWFNQNKEHDWRVNSDPASLEAFRALLI
jgi:beta-mannanase